MNHSGRERIADTIASIERQIAALHKLGGDVMEIAACQAAIEQIKKLVPKARTPLDETHKLPNPPSAGEAYASIMLANASALLIENK
jgi:hypothetical protein